jgi:hypothetical protein
MRPRMTFRATMALAVLLMAGLACNLFPRVPELPMETIPVTTEAVEDLKKEIQEAAEQAAQTGTISLVIKEAELTSLVAFELENQTNMPLTEPQVYLRDGQILVAGNVTQENASLPVSIAVGVSVDPQGVPVFTILAAQLGELPLPQPMVEQFSVELERAFNENIRPRLGDTVIDGILIADGQMTITGHTR